jgi:hypothetical protein
VVPVVPIVLIVGDSHGRILKCGGVTSPAASLFFLPRISIEPRTMEDAGPRLLVSVRSPFKTIVRLLSVVLFGLASICAASGLGNPADVALATRLDQPFDVTMQTAWQEPALSGIPEERGLSRNMVAQKRPYGLDTWNSSNFNVFM